jgi:aryl-alcohol dehydrogenase-like predicted oxidoreductase
MNVHRLPRPDADPVETLAERMERLRAEAVEIAQAHTADFQGLVAETQRYADDIAQGGEAYHVGVREIARSLALELRDVLMALEVLRGRAPERSPAAAVRRAAS